MATLREYYNREYLGAQLDRDEEGNSFRKIESLWPQEQSPSGDLSVLDVGCGAGSVSAHLAQVGCCVHGLDLVEAAVERARSKGLDAVVHDVQEGLPHRDGSFDAVLLLDILEHVFDPLALLEEARRVLREGGFALAVLPLHFDAVHRVRCFLGRGIVSREHLAYSEDHRPWNYFHLRFFTLDEALELFRLGGFRVEATTYREIVPHGLGPLAPLWRGRFMRGLARRMPRLFASAVQCRLRSAP